MEKPAEWTASWAESSPAVAALARVRSQRILSMPDLLKAGFKDSTAPITVIGQFHGSGLAKSTRRFYGDWPHKDAGRLNGTGLFKGAGGFNSPKQLNGKAKSARASESTDANPADTGHNGAPRVGTAADNAESTPVPRRETWTGSSEDYDQPIRRFDTQRPGPKASGGLNLTELLNDSAVLLDSARLSASDEASLLGFVEAADFAGRVEEISRCVEYLQVVAAQAVERSRTEAQQTKPGSSAAAPEWRTGWSEAPEEPTNGTDTGATVPGATVPGAASVLDDGYRNAAEFLRARLRIGIGEARRRLALAPDILPQTGMTGQEIPARREVLAAALSSALVPSRSATIISTALDKVRNLTDQDTIARMEHALTTTAIETDPDFVTKMAKRWADRIDQDGPEPTEETLRQFQGAFLRRRRRHGLHHLEIFATDEQYETLATAMNAATNPRLTTHQHEANTVTGTASPDLDRRTRPQKHLNGLTGACSVAMSTGKLPSNGGLRPQLTVTIDHRDLFERVQDHQQHNQHESTGTAPKQPGTRTHTDTDTDTDTGTGTGTGTGAATFTGPVHPDTDTTRDPLSTGTATFTGPIHPDTIRKIACDADIIPVLLGSDSRILDIGRTTRIFPPHIRKAITARDGGCAFPDCTIPAPWCEAHHTTYWSHGGTTSTNNGTLLCSHHHHLIHKEQWRINMTTGVPWFIPPPHIDPNQTPRRNHHHTPHRT
ncbi:HNH endonuclease signature motif containing protein [Paenarthrobacter aurescens]|uniref:HNH endonuclease signature motif containing protein n=1 Tax=Paenarthrobacter aurescens TaxID=43663 RepID=UPI0021BE8669|nr:HNH endonuclease signature motif containing protein [Paenarthrobacter aurescens]MCT9871113.1 HNH endonuclease [Paenarthrobacter aurescens]